MEHLPGGSLTDRLRDGALPVADVIAISRSLLAGLAHLHAAGIVHRDVKPSNVLFAADGAAKLADFGLLRPLDADAGLTRTGLTVGTPAYMSPEQIRGDEPTPASDLYSLGVTLFELLAGRQPFVATSSLEIAHLHRSARPPELRALRPDCPRWLAAFVERLLAKDPRSRWPDAAGALAAFDRRRPGLSRRTRRTACRRRRRGRGAGGAGGRSAPAERPGRRGGQGRRKVARGQERRRARALARNPAAFAVFAATGDVLPARGPEVVTAEVTDAAGVRSTELVVRDRRGTVLQREPVGHLEASQLFRAAHRLVTTPTGPVLADLDRDGLSDVLLPVTHWPFYPSMVVVWSPAAGRPSQVVLANSGHITDIRVADLDGDGSAELVAVGFNNVLGFQNIVAVVDLGDATPNSRDYGPTSPDLMPLTVSGRVRMTVGRSYTMLGEGRGTATDRCRRRRAASGCVSGARRSGSTSTATPRAHGSGAGAASARRDLWDDCREAQLEISQTPERWERVLAGIEARRSAALAEAPTRDTVLILLARGLGDAGRPDLGAALLARAERGTATNRRVLRHRGELLLLAGRPAEAHAVLERAVAASERGTHPLDEMVILALDAAVNGDGTAFERSRRPWQRTVVNGATDQLVSLAPLKAFLDGAWRDAHPAGARWDDALYHWQALTSWAALEDGAPAAAVLDALAPISGRPEAGDLCRLVRARARMLAGDPRTAADLALQTLIGLEGQARRSYEVFLWQGLAHWVRGAALHDCRRARSPPAPTSRSPPAASPAPGSAAMRGRGCANGAAGASARLCRRQRRSGVKYSRACSGGSGSG